MAAGLTDIPSPALSAAANLALRSCRWFPTVAELRSFAGYGHGDAAADANADAIRAWELALAWCDRYDGRLWNPVGGFYSDFDQRDSSLPPRQRPTPPLPERIFRALRSAGGANRVLGFRHDPAELRWCRRDFCEAYRLLRDDDATLQIADSDAAGILRVLASAMPVMPAAGKSS